MWPKSISTEISVVSVFGPTPTLYVSFKNNFTFKLCNTTSTLFWAFLNEFFHAISMIMTAFWNLRITKHLFQFLNISKLASIGCANVASMTCK